MKDKQIIKQAGQKFGSTQAEALLRIIENNNYTSLLNIGVHKGGSAIVMGLICKRRGYGKVHCVDPWEYKGKVYDEAFESFTNSIKKLEIEKYCPYYKMTSSEFIMQNNPYAESAIKFDFAFIDGDHSQEGVKKDIYGCTSILEIQDILCHDWESRKGKDVIQGVKKAVLNMKEKNAIDIIEEIEYMVRIKPRKL